MVMRFKFARDERVRFLSHLDVMRMFHRAFRRSEIPIAYSNGFNPHPEFVIGLPLGVGVTGEGEYCDVKMEEDITPGKFVRRLDAVMPPGYHVIQAAIRKNNDNIMASISLLLVGLDYGQCEDLLPPIQQMMAQECIEVEKVGKKKSNRVPRMIDIKKMIHYVSVDGQAVYSSKEAEAIQMINEINREHAKKKGNVLLLCAAGSVANVKPELFADALKIHLKCAVNDYIRIHRYGTYIQKGNDVFSPMSPMALEERD